MFSEDFVWGVSTAAYQIEGAAGKDGRKESVWDAFCRKEGAIARGSDGRIACDHYHRYTEDIRLLADLGIGGYRFSLSWSRIIPDGKGAVNPAGVDFYDRLIDTLLEHNIIPCITLFHWDYPLSLYYRGGWLNRDSAYWFAEYARFAVSKFGDRVSTWITQNEPQCFVELGHKTGYHAPGICLPQKEVLQVAHNSLRGHGLAYRACKEENSSLRIGYGSVGVTRMPVEDTVQNREAARNSMFAHTDTSLFTTPWFTDPVFKGQYPADGAALYGADMIDYPAADMEEISSGADFLGVNIYHGDYVDANGTIQDFPRGYPRTAMGWPITPEALYWGPRFLYERYTVPLIISENGMAGTDILSSRGRVDDYYRIEYLKTYISALARAVTEDIPVEGYYLWSAMDNFEWAEGYDKRFGIIYVDYESQKRYYKQSALWYKELIASKGASL
jgi:beta-glucosidase